MRGQAPVPVILLIGLGAAAVPAVGLTDAFGTNAQLRVNIFWISDGAKFDTFWEDSTLDVPGVSVTAVHCHARVRYELQASATGPYHGNPCYAAMGGYQMNSDGSMKPLDGHSYEDLVYFVLPGGNEAVRRISNDFLPWRYCIGDLIIGPPLGPWTAPPKPIYPF